MTDKSRQSKLRLRWSRRNRNASYLPHNMGEVNLSLAKVRKIVNAKPVPANKEIQKVLKKERERA